MKKLTALLLALLMLALPLCSLADDFISEDFIDWFNESQLWMTVANGHWSTDPADRITDEELEKIFSMTILQQNAVCLCFDVIGQLIRLHREEDLALLNGVADVFLPRVYRALGHGKAKLRH